MSPPPPLDPSEFARHSEFLRRLVWDLVRDEDRLDDVIQDTWLTALTRRPSKEGASRSWLGGIARHLALRSAARESRRRKLDRGLAAPDLASSATRQIDELKSVTEALAALDERHQSVLVLRYFHGLPPRDIARETGLPVATVKTRLKRGLARLRERMDAANGGRRAAWVTGLLPLVERGVPLSGLAAVSAGALIMKTKVAAAAVVVALCGAFFAWKALGEEEPTPPAPAAKSAEAFPGERSKPDSKPGTPIDTERFVPELEEASPRVTIRAGEWGVRGAVRWRDGSVVPDAELEFRIQGSASPLQAAADEEGQYALVLGETPQLRYVAVTVEGTRLILSVGWPDALRGDDVGWVDWDIVIPGPSVVRGRVLDVRQNPVEGIGLRVRSTAKEFPESSRLFLTRSDGSFEFRVPFEGQCLLDLWPRLDPEGTARMTGGYRALRAATLTREGVPEGADALTYRPRPRDGGEALELWPLETGKEIVLGPDRVNDVGTLLVGACGRLDFELVDAEDQPVEGVSVKTICPVRGATLLSRPSDGEGLASLEYLPGRRVVWITIDDWHLADREERVKGVPVDVPAAGAAKVKLSLIKELWPLSQKAPSVSISVVDAYRSPVSGARVTWNGREAVTDAEGRADLGAASEDEGPLVIEAEGFARHETPKYRPHPMWTTFVLEANRFATLVVRDASARPVPTVNLLRVHVRTDGRGRRSESIFEGEHDRVDDEGRYAIPPIRPRSRMSVLLVWSRDAGFARVDLAEGLDAGAEREVVLRPVVKLAARLVDARGEPVAGARILSGARDFPLALDRLQDDRSGMSLAGRYSVGDATSAADGSFEVLAPRESGILGVLARDGKVVIQPYAAASTVMRLTVPDPLRLELKASQAPDAEQGLYLFLRHRAVSFRVNHRWPAGAERCEVAVPLAGEWEVSLQPRLLPGGGWGGLQGRVTLDLQGPERSVEFPVKPYRRK